MDTMVWLYLINATLLINHEIDSAYWQEWNLFRLPGGITGFLLMHLPLIFLVLWGLVLLVQGAAGGLYISLGLSLTGLIAFGLHMTFLIKGHPEFRKPVSIALLVAALAVSIVQGWLTVKALQNIS